MYRSILAAIDGSKTSARALDEALSTRPREPRRTPVALYRRCAIDGLRAPGDDPSILRDAMLTEGTRVTNGGARQDASGQCARRGAGGRSRSVWRWDRATHLRVATEMHADLVVMGTHGRRGFQRLMLGSVAERFVRMACCPVLLVPAEHAGAGPGPTRDAVAPVAEPA